MKEALEANEANQMAIASISKLKANQFEMKRKTKETNSINCCTTTTAELFFRHYNFHTQNCLTVHCFYLGDFREKLKRVSRPSKTDTSTNYAS